MATVMTSGGTGLHMAYAACNGDGGDALLNLRIWERPTRGGGEKKTERPVSSNRVRLRMLAELWCPTYLNAPGGALAEAGRALCRLRVDVRESQGQETKVEDNDILDVVNGTAMISLPMPVLLLLAALVEVIAVWNCCPCTNDLLLDVVNHVVIHKT